MSDVPIEEHGFLSDCRSAALVTTAGSVDWWCVSRFDDSPVFGRLLDPEAGHFAIGPLDEHARAEVRYQPRTLVLETRWTSADGEVLVTDALALGPRERGHGLGRGSPGVLLRTVECVRGFMVLQVEYAPRPEAGVVHPRLRRRGRTLVAEGGATTLVLSTDVDLEVSGSTASAVVDLRAGQRLTFAVEGADAWGTAPSAWSARRVRRRMRQTRSGWESWSALHQQYDGPARDLVLRSGLVLRGLSHVRSGAIVAAATTSLPEGLGSGRTWDYRYTWIRDASMTMQGLFTAACPHEAAGFFGFLARAGASQLDEGRPLQIMFGVGGERDLTERELPHLTGWRGSGPVRIGNGAWDQHQLDVYGALVDAAYTLRKHLADLDDQTRTFLVAVVDAAAARWREADQGIWEFRGPAQHFLHSKLMCWVALDRGLRLAELLEVSDEQATRWRTTLAEIRGAILEQGWNDEVGAYTQAFGSEALDASCLLLAIVGFLPGDDARLISTVDAVRAGLVDESGLVVRYRSDDGLGTSEGSFLLCTFWLAHALALTGRVEEAEEVLARGAGHSTPLGLFAEEVDTATGALLGNFPQAFSHLGLVNAAEAIGAARGRTDDAADTDPHRQQAWTSGGVGPHRGPRPGASRPGRGPRRSSATRAASVPPPPGEDHAVARPGRPVPRHRGRDLGWPLPDPARRLLG